MADSEDKTVLAKDIDDCSKCPLYENECPGGWTSGAGGNPIEPPCCSWNEDTKVYEGMYPEIDYSEQSMKWIREETVKREQKEKSNEKR